MQPQDGLTLSWRTLPHSAALSLRLAEAVAGLMRCQCRAEPFVPAQQPLGQDTASTLNLHFPLEAFFKPTGNSTVVNLSVLFFSSNFIDF